MFGRITKRDLRKILFKRPSDLLSLICTIIIALEDMYNIKVEDTFKMVKEAVDNCERD